MKVTLQLNDKSFFFAGDVSITKEAGASKVELDDQADLTIGTIASAVAMGVLRSDVSYKGIVSLIRSESIRADVRASLGIDAVDFVDDTTAKVEIVAVETVEDAPEEPIKEAIKEAPKKAEKKAEKKVEKKTVQDKQEGDSDAAVPEKSDGELLQGSYRTVVARLGKLKLTRERLDSMLETEKAGADRTAIKRYLTEK